MPVTKGAMSKALNDYLGVDIDWTPLSKKDLETLMELFDDPKELVRRIVKAEAETKIKGKSKEIVERAEELLKDVPRPFGIVDRLLERRK